MLAAQRTGVCLDMAHRTCVLITCRTSWLPYTVSYYLLPGMERLLWRSHVCRFALGPQGFGDFLSSIHSRLSEAGSMQCNVLRVAS